jgi:hypothetical protein
VLFLLPHQLWKGTNLRLRLRRLSSLHQWLPLALLACLLELMLEQTLQSSPLSPVLAAFPFCQWSLLCLCPPMVTPEILATRDYLPLVSHRKETPVDMAGNQPKPRLLDTTPCHLCSTRKLESS